MNDAVKSLKFFLGESGIYCVIGTRGTEEWGISLKCVPRPDSTYIEFRFAMLGATDHTKFKFFTSRRKSVYQTKE